jgi:ATP-dependent Clp protease ATP-binding subunit ClpC
MSGTGGDLELTPGARKLVDSALQRQQFGNHDALGTRHWLMALLERHAEMAERLGEGIVAKELAQSNRERLKQGDIGSPLTQDAVMERAAALVRAQGKARIAEREIACVILGAAGFGLRAEEGAQGAAASATPATPTPADTPPAASGYRARAKRATPVLDKFGRDLTRLAVQGKLSPLVGREQELQVILETLLRTRKPNPALIGPAGVGKTAIVEGLAQLIVRAEVPEELQGVRLIEIQLSNLIAGAGRVGELEERMQALLAEAGQDGIVLFIDEAHMMVGGGGMAGTSDVASLLKPALARRDLCCIIATTDDEYRRMVTNDPALERRFGKVDIAEPDAAQTLFIVGKRRDELAALRKVTVPDELLAWMVEFADRYLPDRNFPDKAVDVLEQVVAYTVAQRRREIAMDDALAVAHRMIGMPPSIEERHAVLEQRLQALPVLGADDRRRLLERLEVTVRDLDMRSARPNAVVLLTGEVAAYTAALARAVAGALYGSEERIVEIDFGQFASQYDVSKLIGSPPGYVGYNESLPIHRIGQQHWCVVRCDNVHSSHPDALSLWIQALASGQITDARGKRIHLGDTVVLMSAPIALVERRGIGFTSGSEKPSGRGVAERFLDPALVGECDLVCTELGSSPAERARWVRESLLAELAGKFRKRGLDPRWDDSFVEWAIAAQQRAANPQDWERALEAQLVPLLRQLPPVRGTGTRGVVVKWAGESLAVENVVN